jgi:dTDP-4-dehydrorhamnose reductase
VLARECAQAGVQLLTFSSDLVFDGCKGSPYLESDPPNPLSVYGRSKVAAEERVRCANPGALVIRTSAFFGPWDRSNFAARTIHAIRRGEPVRFANDITISPTYVPDLVDACLDLLIDGETGLWHLSNGVALSWADAARATAHAAGIHAPCIDAVTSGELRLPALRPCYSALGTERGALLPPLDDALTRWAAIAA